MEGEKVGVLKRFWGSLRKPSVKYSVAAIGSLFFVLGIIFWGGFNTALEATNTLDFCITCHEMRDNVYQEYKKTIHYSNRTGVRAICSDCHVPHDWTHKLIRKAKASFEIWGKITGVIDTKEKFEANRMRLATNEWERMKATDSRECRNCHSFEAMSGDVQGLTIYKVHMKAKEDRQTCIDCHKGIAHHLPKEYRDPNEEE
ncbi:MAG TPA: NapC/NirT family cytochrome c [Thiobacillaceae bacterium]|nr:NapC/NirT family cytochrome c [Thiobacillaceae bacterium]